MNVVDDPVNPDSPDAQPSPGAELALVEAKPKRKRAPRKSAADSPAAVDLRAGELPAESRSDDADADPAALVVPALPGVAAELLIETGTETSPTQDARAAGAPAAVAVDVTAADVAAPVAATVPAPVQPLPLFTVDPLPADAAPFDFMSAPASEAIDPSRILRPPKRGRRGSGRRDDAAPMAEDSNPNLSTANFDLDPDDESLAATDESVDELAPPVDAGELFAEVLSGAYDAEPVVDGAAAVAERRVLAAEIDAPKLQKVLAQAGIGSRRDMEQLIVDGQITVNGQAAHIGQRIAFGDQIKVAGRPIKYRIAPPQTRVLAYHKPVGEVVTNDDPQNRPTVFRKLPRLANGKWQSIGRLDINTEGLLLFTNSGDLANQLMHPRFGVEREYAVRVLGTLEDDARQRLISGVEIASVPASFRSIEDGGGEGVNRWYRVVITEGRNREVRKLFDAVGLTVNRLIRIRYGCVVLPRGLKRGVWIDLEDRDVRALRQIAGLREPQVRSANVEEVARPIRPQRGPRDRGGKRGPERVAERNVERPSVVDRGPERGVDRGPQRHVARGADRGPGPGAERGPIPDRGPVNDRGPDRGPRQDRSPGPDRGPGVDRRDSGPRREPGEGGPIPNPLQQTYDRRAIREARAPRREFPEDGPIPNPLEQTYDKRFVQKQSGPGGRKGEGNNQGQPDPMQTSMGYIGADTFYRKMDGGGGRGGGGGRRRGR